MTLSKERSVAIEAVLSASRLCVAVQARLVSDETLAKKDKSPVTVADFGAQAVVSHALAAAFPAIPLVGEEDAGALRAEGGEDLRAKVVRAAQAITPSMSEADVLAAIDRGVYEGGAKGRAWALDPIDGTLGFLRREQYAVALALIEDGEVVLGVLGCPSLPHAGGTGALFVATKGGGAFVRSLDDDREAPIRVSSITDPALGSFTESVESGHSSHGDAAVIAERLGVTAPPVRMDSQCKYAAVARGEASIYLRLPTKKGYEEKIWDHAAGCLLVKEAGGEVTDTRGAPLDFSRGRTLRDNAGVVATNGALHARVVDVVKGVLAIKSPSV
jgi:3'(2'), 5'-bisphosphate nucleotidase